MSNKTCTRCAKTNSDVIRYPLDEQDKTINLCSSCASEVKYKFP